LITYRQTEYIISLVANNNIYFKSVVDPAAKQSAFIKCPESEALWRHNKWKENWKCNW